MKKIFLNSLIFISIVTTSAIAHKDTYPRFAVSNKDISAVLNNGITVPVNSKKELPADITFACADIKYKDGKLKFCECGDGIYMSFRTAQVILNEREQAVVSPYWGIFWHYLKQFGLPIWLIDSRGAPHAMALEEFAELGGKYASSLANLQKDPVFAKLSQKTVKSIQDIDQYKGIIVYRASRESKRDCSEVALFKKQYPQFLFVNTNARDIVKRKDKTYETFVKAHLEDYVPVTKVYSSKNADEATKDIFNTIPSDWVIIKPVFSSLACGVNVVDKKDLHSFLQLILHNKKNIKSSHRGLTYWRNNKTKQFVAAEYAPSKTIYKDNAPYDPTMRIVYMMSHNNGKIYVNVIAGFWKIPVESLQNKNVTLTEKHVTIAHAGAYYSGILADKKDWREIKSILEEILPKFYTAILEQNATA
jgi:hypothetical protein